MVGQIGFDRQTLKRRGSLLLLLLCLWATPAWAQPFTPYPPVACTASAFYDNTLTGLQTLVAAQAGMRIYVCGVTINTGVAGTVQLNYGTGTACGTGTMPLTPAWNLAANGSLVQNLYGGPLIVPPGNALCAAITGTSPTVKILLTFLQVPNA